MNALPDFLKCLLISGRRWFGVILFLPSLAFGELLVGTSDGVISEYTPGGQLIKTPFIGIPGLPVAMVHSADFTKVLVSNYSDNGRIGLYNKFGTPINSTLINNLYYPYAMALDGNNLYIASDAGRTISVYNTSGTLLNSQLITL